MINLILFPLTILIVFFLVWGLLYRPSRDLKGSFSVNILKDVLPDIQKSSNLIITLSSSAFLLTLTILQYLKGGKIVSVIYLYDSWALFTMAIVFGVAISIVIYMLKAQMLVMINGFEKIKDVEEGQKAELNEKLEKLLKRKQYFQNIMFVFLLCQSVSFMTAFLFLISFAKNNYLS